MNTVKSIFTVLFLFAIGGCASHSPNINSSVQSNHFIEQDEPTISIKPIPTEQQEAKENGAKSNLNIVPQPSPAPIAIQPIWTLTSGHTINQDMQAWASKAGWKLIWNMNQDWAVPATTNFTGDFQTAATTVINTMASNGALIRAQFYSGNKTLVVVGPGVTSR
ncbi:MAG TPA: toxin co-regulated pilus biosynthesis Q family protein [Noviherbaspirillum sp.]|nr:toxin co-regulated pilus biosynthesis Q family protein [Noviherbaspirillum sp.]